jgi:DNA-binding transcriptional ArsR family regulator
MALNKKNEFEENKRKLAEFAKAISHPARIAILQTIAEKKECICGEIVEVIPLAQSTISQHLKELKEVGFIQGDIEGAKSCYCINWKKLDEFHNSINQIYKSLNKHKKNSKLECCD